jgi:hypothetical protein
MKPVDFFGTPNPLRSHLKAKLLSILGSADSDIDCTRELLRSGLKRLKLEVTVEDVKRGMRAHYHELKAQLKLCESGPPFPDAVTLDEFHSHCQPDHEIERINSEYTYKFYQLFKDMHADHAVSICCCVLSYCYDKAVQADTERAERADNADNADNAGSVDIEEDAVVHVTSDEEEDSEDESEEDSDDESEELNNSDNDEESGENSEEDSEEEDESSASSEEGDEDEKGSPEDKMKNKKRQNTESSEESEEEDERTSKGGKGGENCSSDEGDGDDDHHQAHEPHPKRKK